MENTMIIGVIASTGTGVCMLPQLIKIIQAKKAENISKPMILILILSLSLWIAYGVMKKDPIIIVSNAISLLINFALLFFSILYRNRSHVARHYI